MARTALFHFSCLCVIATIKLAQQIDRIRDCSSKKNIDNSKNLFTFNHYAYLRIDIYQPEKYLCNSIITLT